MDLWPAHINYTRNVTECLSMVFVIFEMFWARGEKLLSSLEVGGLPLQWGHWWLMVLLALQIQLYLQDIIFCSGLINVCWVFTLTQSICLHDSPKSFFFFFFNQETQMYWISGDCLIFQGVLLNFHKLCSILLRHWGHFNIFLPAAELVAPKDKKSGRTYFIKHSLHSTADTRLNMVIWIYCWDESRGNTTCTL